MITRLFLFLIVFHFFFPTAFLFSQPEQQQQQQLPPSISPSLSPSEQQQLQQIASLKLTSFKTSNCEQKYDPYILPEFPRPSISWDEKQRLLEVSVILALNCAESVDDAIEVEQRPAATTGTEQRIRIELGYHVLPCSPCARCLCAKVIRWTFSDVDPDLVHLYDFDVKEHTESREKEDLMRLIAEEEARKAEENRIRAEQRREEKEKERVRREIEKAMDLERKQIKKERRESEKLAKEQRKMEEARLGKDGQREREQKEREEKQRLREIERNEREQEKALRQQERQLDRERRERERQMDRERKEREKKLREERFKRDTLDQTFTNIIG